MEICKTFHNIQSLSGGQSTLFSGLLGDKGKNATDLLQVVNFTELLQFVNKLQQACQFHQVATTLLRLGLLQLVICRVVTTC